MEVKSGRAERNQCKEYEKAPGWRMGGKMLGKDQTLHPQWKTPSSQNVSAHLTEGGAGV